jgi:hypothetical protein
MLRSTHPTQLSADSAGAQKTFYRLPLRSHDPKVFESPAIDV